MIPIDICIRIMLRCPNLIETYIHELVDEWDPPSSIQELLQDWFPEPVVFGHLVILLWPLRQNKWANAFLRQMRTPQLHTLKLTRRDSIGSGAVFPIKQLPPTLKTLEVEGIHLLHKDILHSLLNIQLPVEHLILSECTFQVLSKVFQALLGSEGTSNSNYLPQLKSLSIQGCVEENGDKCMEFVASDLHPLIQSLECRLGQGENFKLELSGFAVDWTPRAQQRLKGLLRKGVRLEIIEDGEPSEWLQLN
jgi:hypothetical protein